MYTGKTRKLGVMGYPVEHSLSPYFHNKYLQAKKMDYMYMALPVKPEELGEYLNICQNLGFVGLNLTIPHKVEVLKYLDKVDPQAKEIGAVNTLVLEDDQWVGYNTDAFGFAYPLQQLNTLDVAIVIGNGGAARAVLSALATLGLKKIYLAVRNQVKGQGLRDDFPRLKIEIIDLADSGNKAWGETDIIINTTPVGMTGQFFNEKLPIPWEQLKDSIYCYDLIYTPAKTAFLRQGEERGHHIINGMTMLAAQGAKSLELWSGQPVDIALMVQILEDYLTK